MKPSEIRRILQERGLRLTRGLGQNFLHDSRQLDRVIEAAELAGDEKILEIGPGLGPLTRRLLEAGGEVLAVEKDLRLLAYLRESLGDQPKLELLGADARRVVRDSARHWEGWFMVSNLPYSVASPLLVDLALARPGPQRMVVTVQHEVARRLAAQPGTPDYGILSLLLQLHYQPRLMFQIPAGCFFPPPEVTSACVRLDRRREMPLEGAAAAIYVQLVKLAFSQRRKMMRKLLKAGWPEPLLDQAYEALGLSREVRAERVSREGFIALAQLLAAHAPRP